MNQYKRRSSHLKTEFKTGLKKKKNTHTKEAKSDSLPALSLQFFKDPTTGSVFCQDSKV